MVIVHPMKEIMCKRQWAALGQGSSNGGIETGAPRGVERLRKKARYTSKKPEKHTSGAKAHVDFARLMPGINPRPTARKTYFCERSILGLPDQSPAYRSREFFRGP